MRKIDRTGCLRSSLGALTVSGVYLTGIAVLLTPVAQAMGVAI